MKIIEIEDIFNVDECDGIFPMIGHPNDPQRTTLYDIYKNEKLLQLTRDIIKIIMLNGINYNYSEEELLRNAQVLQGMTYTGDIFVEHYDSYDEEMRELDPQGQRIITGLVYLNDDFTGGKTHFIHQDKYITPKKNKLCLFTNVNDDLTLDVTSLHRSTPVYDGYKSVFNVWFREKPNLESYNIPT